MLLVRSIAGAVLFALGLAACGAPPAAPALPPTVTVPPSAASPSAAPAAPDPCAEAAPAVAFLEAVRAGKAHPGEEDCAARAGMAALPSCPSLAAAWGAPLAEAIAKERADVSGVEVHGPWAVQKPYWGDDRIWEITPDGAVLRYRIDRGHGRFLGGDRMLVESAAGLTLLDLRTGAVHEAPGARFIAEDASFLFAADAAHALRLRPADLSTDASVAYASTSGNFDARVLRGGAALAWDGALLSFEAGKVLRTDQSLGSARPDGARITACDAATQSIVEIDTTTGATTASFRLAGGVTECGSMSYADAAHAPDPRYLFWFELGEEVRDGGRRLVVAVGDTVTGKVQRRRDPSARTGIGFSTTAHLDETRTRLCVDVHSFHSSFAECDWKLGPGGTIASAPSPRRVVRPTLRDLGLKDLSEAARARSPSGARTAIAVYREPQNDLTLVVVGEHDRIERRIVLRAGEFPLDTSGMVSDGVHLAEGTYLPPPALRFLDETHLAYEAPYFPCNRVDLAAGKARFDDPICSDDPLTAPDEKRGRRVKLVAPDAAWAAAPRIASKCR